jgi:hypothetical protein
VQRLLTRTAPRRADPPRCPAVGRCRTCVGRSDDDVVEVFDGRTDDRSSAPDRLYPSPSRLMWPGGLLFNSGHQNGSLLISAIRVARAKSWFLAQPPHVRPVTPGPLDNGERQLRQCVLRETRQGRTTPSRHRPASDPQIGRAGECAPPAVACRRSSTGLTGTGGPLPVSQPDSSASSTIDASQLKGQHRPCSVEQQECYGDLLLIV